jgi:hypothetical protein
MCVSEILESVQMKWYHFRHPKISQNPRNSQKILEILDFFWNILDLDFLGRGSKFKKEIFFGIFWDFFWS